MAKAFLACRVSCFLIFLIIFLLVPQGVAAAAANSSYSTSFSTQETGKFWSSTPSGNYTFGFRKVNDENGSSARYLLSIWHTDDSVNQTALWWADFGGSAEPVVAEGATLNHSATTGTLELYDPSSTLQWSTGNKSSAAAATRIEFLDSGNLRLLDTNHNDSISWETFQHLTNVLMLGGLSADVIQNKPYLLRSRQNGSSYAAGKYHMGTDERFAINLYGIDQEGNQYRYMKDYNVTVNMSSEGMVSVGPQLVYGAAYETSEPELDMLSLDVDGQMRVYRWFSSNFSWSQVWELESLQPIQCRIGNPCGPFGICTVNDDQITVNCSCLTGYHAISGQDPSQGCARDIPLPACGVQNSTYNVTINEEFGKDYYYNDLTWYSNVSTIDECKTICLSECACIAATYSEHTCYLKGNTTTDYLVNGLTRTSSTNLLVKLAVPFDTQTTKQGSKKRVIIAVATSVLAVVLVAVLAIWAALWVVWRGRRARHGRIVEDAKPAAAERRADVAPGFVRFTYKELVQATSNFSHPLSKGGINGVVYKGWIKHKKKKKHQQQSINYEEVAVKMIEIQSSSAAAAADEEEQLEADVGALSKIHHINLVRLLGFCIRKKKQKKMSSTELLLVYEYMAKGSLDTYLELSSSSSPTTTTTTVVVAPSADDDDHEKDDMQQVEFQQRGRAPLRLPWPTRYSIALGAARGIAYLHHDCNPPIFHSNLKPHNILLDSQFTPKVTDFGLASCRRPDNTTRHDGYAAPECRELNQGMTTAADVYSFGMVLLELIRGSIGHDHSSLLEWATRCSSGETEEEEKDENNEQKVALLKLALLCVQEMAEERPTMERVVQAMEMVDEQRAAVYMEDPPNPAMAANRRMAMAKEEEASEVANLSYSVLSAR